MMGSHIVSLHQRNPDGVHGSVRRFRATLTIPAVTAMMLGLSMDARAHTEVRPTPETLWTMWKPDPLIVIGLLLMSWLYLRGTAELWRRAGPDRGVRRWQVWSFYGGVISFALAKVSPLDALGGALFSAHMVQHLVVFLVSPLLFAASRPMLPVMWALPASWRRSLNRWWSARSVVTRVWPMLNHWVSMLMLFAGVLWLWHVPRLYDAALESQLVHGIEHISFAVAAFLFWSVVLDAGRPEGIGHGPALLMVFGTALHSSALGALLTFADFRMYVSHDAYTEAWGLTPLEDQQLAGVIMWVPMGMGFTIVALALVSAWIRAADRSVRRQESEDAALQTQRHIGTASLIADQPVVPGRN